MKKNLLLIIIIISSLIVIAALGFFGKKFYRNKQSSPITNSRAIEDINTGAKYLEDDEVDVILKAVKEGEKQYLDPVGAARLETLRYGFSENDSFILEQKNYAPPEDAYLAVVIATHKGINYDIVLLQSGRTQEGVWLVGSVEKKR